MSVCVSTCVSQTHQSLVRIRLCNEALQLKKKTTTSSSCSALDFLIVRAVICALGATFCQNYVNKTKEEEMNRNENCFFNDYDKTKIFPRLLVFTSSFQFLLLWDADMKVEANPQD